MPLWQLVQHIDIQKKLSSGAANQASQVNQVMQRKSIDFALFGLLQLQVKNEEIWIYWYIRETTPGLENTRRTCHGKAILRVGSENTNVNFCCKFLIDEYE